VRAGSEHIAAAPNNNNSCFITDEGRFNLTMFVKVISVQELKEGMLVNAGNVVRFVLFVFL
jgi:hypothetical protein